MKYAKNAGLALLALAALIFGVLVVVRLLDATKQPTAAESANGAALSGPHTTISIAKFSAAGTVDNCADVTFSPSKEIDVTSLQARGFTVLKSTCSKVFRNLETFATCTRSDPDGDAQPSTTGVAYYYDVGTIDGDDTYRGQCLGNGGSWSAKAPTDPQYAKARARTAGSRPHHEFDSLMELAP